MSSHMEKLRDEFQDIYSKLDGEYEGYIQVSDRRIEEVFVSKKKLPSLEKIYDKESSYVVEMALFEPRSSKSILARQCNSSWLVLEKELTQDEIANADEYFTLINDELKMKIVQIWESKANEFCLGKDVLEARYLMFAGFTDE